MRGLLSQKRILWRLVMTLAGFVFYGLGVCHYRLLVQSPVIWQIECGEDGSQTEEDYERIRESQEKEGQQGGKEPAVASAFWRKEEGQTAENPSLNRTAAVTVWKVRGSLEVLFQSSAALAEEDWQGCYLSADIAWELFGSQDVSGNQLTCGTRQLMVRGILEEETALLIMRPEAAETTNRITLEEESSVRVENFLMSYNLPGRASGTGVLAEILQWILLLFPGVLAAGFLMNFSGLLAEKREYVLFQAVGKLCGGF